MNFKERKEQVKTWVKENKGKIVVGLGVVTAGALMYLGNKVSSENIKAEELLESEEFDQGKDLEIHFIDPESKEVLWKELCTESYMNQSKVWGIQYEAVRKLNGIEEA